MYYNGETDDGGRWTRGNLVWWNVRVWQGLGMPGIWRVVEARKVCQLIRQMREFILHTCIKVTCWNSTFMQNTLGLPTDTRLSVPVHSTSGPDIIYR